MLKKALLALVIFFAVPHTVSFASFKDINEYLPEYEKITELEILGIIDGDEDGSFNPYRPVTRAEFTKMVITALGEDHMAQGLANTKFNDCKGHWAEGYIEAGVSNGFINGHDEHTFDPDGKITFVQAVKMLVAATGYTKYAENSGGWYAGYIKYGHSLGITKGISGIENNTPITRSTVAVMIDNALDVPLAVCTYNGEIWISDGKQGHEYSTMMIKYHNAYRVKGRITGTSRSAKDIPKGYVRYQIEVSDNFDGERYFKEPQTFQMKVGSADMTDYLFIYTNALVRKDKETDEYTILTIKTK